MYFCSGEPMRVLSGVDTWSMPTSAGASFASRSTNHSATPRLVLGEPVGNRATARLVVSSGYFE
jgi:hypothetical protein